jgi:glycogen synthase
VRVLVYTPAFHPSVGGLEAVTDMSATALAEAGVEVTVVTTTAARPGGAERPRPYRLVRRPRPAELLRLARECDIFMQANVSLKGLWPLIFARRPWVVTHHSWYRRPDGRIAWRDRLKRLLLHRATSVAVSRAMADDLTAPTLVLPNPYRDDRFTPPDPGAERPGDLIAVGRLVSDKGFDVLLDALTRLERRGPAPGLTLVGDGPEGAALRAQAANLGLAGRVTFAGQLTGRDLVAALRRHRVLVVPSRYREPFGIVALEGLACGCRVVGSAGGGLADAIGPGGVTFPNGDAQALADRLEEELARPAETGIPTAVAAHLAHHTRAAHGRALADLLAAVHRRGRLTPAGWAPPTGPESGPGDDAHG